MPAVPLPVVLEEKLDDVAAEVRRLRVLRGASWFAAVTFALPLLFVALDVLLDLSPLVRGLMLGGWVAVCAFLGWWLVVRRTRGEIPPRELAAAVEREFPNLAERLSTLVELSEHADAGNGSRGMIAVLAKETEKRAKKLNFGKVAPTGFSLRLAGFAVLVGLLAVTPLFAFREAGDRVRRLVLPWYTPPVEVPYTLTVSSGNPVVKRGEPVTLSAYLEKTKPEAELPTSATLVYRVVGQSEERRLPMSGDDRAAFTVTRPKVDAEFEYKVQCGELTSAWFGVAVVDPVEVDESGSKVTVVSPKYKGTPPVEQKWGQVKTLQHSTATFELRFTRTPADVHAEWRTADQKAEAVSLNRSLTFSDDRRTVTLTVPCPANGTVRFSLFADKGVRTDVPVAVEADADLPPRFERAGGVPTELREVKKDAVLPLDVAVADDVAVGGLFFDYAPANAPPDEFRSEPLAGIKVGGTRAEGKVEVSLAGKAALGDTIRVRLRATDNRSLPDLGLGPNETVYPSGGWAQVRVVANARPLTEQDILAQKEELRKKLVEAAAKVQAAERMVAGLKKETAGKPMLTAAQAAEAAAARELAQQAARTLDEAAADAARTPDLAPVAQAARQIAEEPLANAEDELRKAGTDPKPEPRDESIKAAQTHLDAAEQLLDKLKKLNEETAAARLDRSKLDELAKEQQQIGKEAKEADADKRAELLERQKELADRLKQLREESEALKKANAEAERQKAEELAAKLQELAQRQRELDEAVEKSEQAARREQLDELKKLQQKLNEDIRKLADKTDRAAAQPLDRVPAEKAEGLLEKQKAADALTEQEKAARELDRLAEEMSLRAKDRGDAKQAVEQLKRWQEDLNRRTAQAAKNNPDGVPQAEMDKLTAEQKAIQKATERLQLPKSDSLEKLRDEAKAGAKDAADGLQKSPADAADAQKKVADALDRLAEKTPSNQQRRAAAKQELEKLRREQEQLSKEAKEASDAAKGNPDDPATRDELAKKLEQQAAKQDELNKKVRDLDTPGAENRRDRAAAAGRQAGEDLKGGLPQDIPASQEDTRRQMDRLAETLDGKTPADEKASELARLQRELSKNLQKSKTPEDVARLQRQQQEISREVAKLKAPEAQGQLADAQDAARAADRAAQKQQPDVDELKKKGEQTADALDTLAERLGGESPEQRLERLAKNRQVEAEKAKEAEKSRDRDLTRTRHAQKQVDKDLADLNDTRTGDTQDAKRKLQDVLVKLAKNPEPDKAKDLQQQAADAARKLADAVKQKGDRADAAKLGEPKNPDPADPTDPGNALPTEKDAQAARELAKKQRELRDDVAKAAERSAKGEAPKPGAGDPLGDAAKEQAEIAKAAGDLADRAKAVGDPSADPAAGGAKAADKAANELKSGDTADAKQAAEDAAGKLRDAAKAAQNPDLKAKAEELAKKQERLAKQAGEADVAAARTRQQNRQGELKAEADRLADKVEGAAKESEKGSPTGKNLGDAADAARNAGKQMGQAERSGKNGQPQEASDARQQAERKLEDAARLARGSNKQPDPNAKRDPNARLTDDALREAAKGMEQSEANFQQGSGEKAAEAAGKAADALKKASDQLNQAVQEGQPKDQPGRPGSRPGSPPNTPPSGDVPSIVLENLGKSWGELPGDVRSKITQELKAKYGDDYARVIKLYFEQLAERK